MDSEYNQNSSTSSTKSILVVILVLSIITSLYFFFIKDKRIASDNSLNSKSPVSEGLSVEDQLNGLYKRSKIFIPTTISENDISSKNLPLDFILLFGVDVTYDKIKSVVYDNNSSGFEVEFVYPNSVIDSYFNLRNSLKREDWKVVYGSRYNDSGIFNIENEKYGASIVLVKLDNMKTRAKVLIINKEAL